MYAVDHLTSEDGKGGEVREDLAAFVKLADGKTVQLTSGDTVPDDADPADVQRLVDAGVLTEADDPTPTPDPVPVPAPPAGRGKPKAGAES
jgi:hypothetical protein